MLISLNGVLQTELVKSPNAPVVSLLTPNVAAELSGRQMVTWEASDADEGSVLFYDVDYSPNGGEIWLPLGSYVAEPFMEVDFNSVPGGDDAFLRVSVSDGWNTGEDISDSSFTIPAHSPEITLLEPIDQASFFETQPFYAEAIAFDWEDGPISDLDSYTWLSDIDGILSTGPWAALAAMTPGDHTLTIQVSDSDGNISEASLLVTILDVEGFPEEPVLDEAVQPQSNMMLYIGVGLIMLALVVVLLRRSRRNRQSS
jgi:hypothetical protein